MKYWIAGLTVLALLLVTGIFLAPKIYLKILEKKITDISIEETAIGKDYFDLNVRINLTENGLPEFVDSISYQIVIYDSVISNGSKKVKRQAEKEELVFPARLKYHLLEDQIKKHQREESEISIYMEFYCSFPILGHRKIKVKKQAEMQVPVIPEVRIENIELLKFGLDNMELMLSMSVNNPNNIDFIIREINYHITLEEYAISSGKISKDHRIRKHGLAEITFPVTVDLKHEIKGLYKILKGNRDWSYTMKADLLLKPSDSRLNSVALNTEKRGRIDVIKGLKAAKNKESIKLKRN
jgi:LEA14-like dessication related protein